MLSIVIPIHNEEPAILPLYDRLTAVMEQMRRPYEIIFVDDASTDKSFDLLANLVETDARLKVLRLRRNFGQTAALAAGLAHAQGDVVILMDGDAQNDPADIPALLIVTEWNEFRRPDFTRVKNLLTHPVIFDGRNVYDPAELRKLGFIYYSIGRNHG